MLFHVRLAKQLMAMDSMCCYINCVRTAIRYFDGEGEEKSEMEIGGSR